MARKLKFRKKRKIRFAASIEDQKKKYAATETALGVITESITSESFRINDSTKNPTELSNHLTEQIQQLTTRVDTMEQQFQIIKQGYDKMTNEFEALKLYQQSLKDDIAYEQDRVNSAEAELLTLEDDHYMADYPPLMRFFFRVMGVRDEIFIRSEIAKREAKISQWERHLTEVNKSLAVVLVYFKKIQNDIQSINSAQESIRQTRVNFISLRRTILHVAKVKINQENQRAIISNFINNANELKKMGTSFLEVFHKNQQNAEEAVNLQIKLNSNQIQELPENENNLLEVTNLYEPQLIELIPSNLSEAEEEKNRPNDL